MESSRASALFTASISLDISPLDAISRSGFAGSPGFGANSKLDTFRPVRTGSPERLDQNLKLAPLEPEIEQLRGNLRGQFRRCLPPAPRQCGSGLDRLTSIPLDRRFELRQRIGAILEPRKLQLRRLEKLERALDASAELALERFDPVDAVFERRDRRGIELDALDVVPQERFEFIEFDKRGFGALE